MMDINHKVTDPLTAYLIGWTDELSDDAMNFLQDTKDTTKEEVKKAVEEEVFTGTTTFRWGEKATYTGEVESGIPHGKGELIWDSGEKYIGDFCNGKIEGYGTYISSDGTEYSGHWVDNELVEED